MIKHFIVTCYDLGCEHFTVDAQTSVLFQFLYHSQI